MRVDHRQASGVDAKESSLCAPEHGHALMRRRDLDVRTSHSGCDTRGSHIFIDIAAGQQHHQRHTPDA
jgi:hypothetical protein